MQLPNDIDYTGVYHVLTDALSVSFQELTAHVQFAQCDVTRVIEPAPEVREELPSRLRLPDSAACVSTICENTILLLASQPQGRQQGRGQACMNKIEEGVQGARLLEITSQKLGCYCSVYTRHWASSIRHS
ncbi:hypothetical protein ElyMa_006647100 [Elysia marginata]|uniref:Uncharacterized protein n=1 Tax=Elysia marginata TaxID=1093978 RepID=A0AAV4IEP2_9GAST|nr:hypothetical protein ElyMa_006647100 [Elysia marginata]